MTVTPFDRIFAAILLIISLLFYFFISKNMWLGLVAWFLALCTGANLDQLAIKGSDKDGKMPTLR